MASAFLIPTNLEAEGENIVLRISAVVAGSGVPNGRQITEFRINVVPGEALNSLKAKIVAKLDEWGQAYGFALDDVTMPTFMKKGV